jgi:hypothetical protein
MRAEQTGYIVELEILNPLEQRRASEREHVRIVVHVKPLFDTSRTRIARTWRNPRRIEAHVGKQSGLSANRYPGIDEQISTDRTSGFFKRGFIRKEIVEDYGAKAMTDEDQRIILGA